MRGEISLATSIVYAFYKGMKSRKKSGPRRPDRVGLKLKAGERRYLRRMLRHGEGSVRVFNRARALQLLDAGKSAPQAADAAGLGEETVRRIARRYAEGGLQRALYDLPRPGAEPLLDQRQEARIVAMVCSKAPDGLARWSISLIAKEAVSRGIVPTVSDETIRRLLHRHELKPWREKNVVRRGSQ